MIIHDIPTDEIKEQTLRRPINSHAITELAGSIKKHGILEPILVAKDEDGIHLIAGQRRLTAAKTLALATVPCHILDADHETALSISLHENLQREQLSAFDESQAYKYLTTHLHYSGRDIARMIGKSEPYVSQRLHITTWCAELQEALRADQLGFAVCRELAMIGDLSHQKTCLRSAIDYGVNCRTARAWRINWQKDQSTVPVETEPPIDESPEAPPLPIMTDCFSCTEHFPIQQTVIVKLCQRCFSEYQDALLEAQKLK
jgi:ParB family chromosome partitioning protein